MNRASSRVRASRSPTSALASTQQLTTNSSGYFEAPLLIAGTYEVVVEMTGFKTLRRAGVTLSSGQQLALPLALEIGTIAEEITVTGEAPLLEVNTLQAGTGPRREEDHGTARAVEHAGAVCAVRAGHDGERRDSVRRTGIRRRSYHQRDPSRRCGWRRLVDRRRDEQRGQPADVHLAEHGHGAGDARRVDELHGVNRPRHRCRHLDDDQSRYQYASRHSEPPGTGRTSSTRRTGFSKSCSTEILAPETAYEEGLSHNLSLTFGGPVRDSGDHQRHEQTVHVRELLHAEEMISTASRRAQQDASAK